MTKEEASQLAFMLRKTLNGTDPILAMESTLYNLGLRKHSSLGVTKFDPIIHQDIVGGLIRGDMCEVIESGYLYKETESICTRARVKPVK